MPNLLSRIFRSRSTSRDASFRASEPSLNQTSRQPSRTSSKLPSSASVGNLGSYAINPKELEKYKLHKASWEGKISKVRRLTNPAQIDAKDQQSRTPLHLAVVKGDLEIVQFLIQEDAKLHITDADGRTPLVKAVLSGTKNPQQNYQICQALIAGDGGQSINARDRLGKTALHYAIEYGDENLALLIISNEYCDVNVQDADGMTPLHVAIKRNSPKVVEALLSPDAEPEADPNITNRYEQTPLHTAALAGYDHIVRLLLLSNLQQQCDLTLLDSQQCTAYDAAKTNHHDVCAKIIQEYQEKYLKRNPSKVLSSSLHEQPSARLTSSVSLTPARNVDRRDDETSDESSSMATGAALKPLPVNTKRPSDQWSDDNGSSMDLSKAQPNALAALMRSNPLQVETANATPAASSLTKIVQQNPLHSSRKTTVASNGKPETSSQAASFVGIGPVLERFDSDNTSQSVSLAPKPTQAASAHLVPKPILRTVSSNKSWSDDTPTKVTPAKPIPIVKKDTPASDTWDTSSLTQSDEDETGIYKPKLGLSNLIQTQPLSPSTQNLTDSDSDNDSFETEIRRLDIDKTAGTGVVHKLVQPVIGTGYKVIGPEEMSSPVSEGSSWTSPVEAATNNTLRKLVHEQPLVSQKVSESTWDDSRPLSSEAKSAASQLKDSEDASSSASTKKMNDTNQSKSPKVVGKLLVSSMAHRPDSLPSEHNSLTSLHTPHPVDADHHYETISSKKDAWSVKAPTEDEMKTSLPANHRSTLTNERPTIRGSVSSTASSFNDARVHELRESIKKLERNQEDSMELKRQLKAMEKKKNEFEDLYRQQDRTLRDVESKLQQEKNEKQQLEWTTKNLNLELKHIREKLQSIADEKDRLNQRCAKLSEERDQYDENLRQAQMTQVASSKPTTVDENDLENLHSRHRHQMKDLSAVNDVLHHRSQQLQSDVDLHKDTLDQTARYRRDLEKAVEEKMHYQQEYDRVKREKDQINQEKIEYKIKYDCLQEEIRAILLDRSKLEQQLTGELQEQIQQRQRSKDDLHKYKAQIEQVNTKLSDAEARLSVLQTQNDALSPTKDRNTNGDHYDTVPARFFERASQSGSNAIPEQRSPSLSNQEQEHPARSRRMNETDREVPTFNRSLPPTSTDGAYPVGHAQNVRVSTARMKNELDRLRQDFDRLVSSYDPPNSHQQQAQLHSHIDTFRQYYDQEFRQRQALMAKLTPSSNNNARTTVSPPLNTSLPPSVYSNNRPYRERLDNAVDSTLADERSQAINQILPIPRQASALLTINTSNSGARSSADLLRQTYHL